MDHERQRDNSKAWFGSKANLVLLGCIAIIGFFLITEHRAHLYGVLPFVFLLACPLMHLFMHHGHGDHGDESRSGRQAHPEKGGNKG